MFYSYTCKSLRPHVLVIDNCASTVCVQDAICNIGNQYYHCTCSSDNGCAFGK